MNHQNRLFALLLAAFFALLPASLFAQRSVQVDVLFTYDYPGGGTSTTPFGINQNGDIAGYFVDATGATRGFIRYRNGAFSAPIIAPDDSGRNTLGIGINDAQTVVGYYTTPADNSFHGYFLDGNGFNLYDVPGSIATDVLGINNAGDVVGNFVDSSGNSRGFLSVGGTITPITISGAVIHDFNGIDSFDRIVGAYTDSAANYHGVSVDASGNISAPLDYPGSVMTLLRGINDRGLVVGRYINPDGAVHGLILKLPNSFVTFDYPGALETSLNGISNAGFISGRYTDTAGVRHGFVAKIRR